MASLVLSHEVWDETLAAVAANEGYIFSSLHQDVDHIGIWVASAIQPPEAPCTCCGKGGRDYHFITGRGNSPDSALNDLTRLLLP